MADETKKPTETTKKTTKTTTTRRKSTAKKVAEAVGGAAKKATSAAGSITKGSVKGLTGLELPSQLQTAAQDVSGYLTKIKDVASPQSFIEAGWQRVTKEQRETDAEVYAELRNFAANLEDGIKTSQAMVKANTAKAKLAGDLVNYATAVEGVNTSMVGYEIQQAKTLKSRQDLADAQRQTQHAIDVSSEREQLFVQELADVRETVSEKVAAIEARRQKRLNSAPEA